MAGINKRPKFRSTEERDWFEKTPKWVLFALLRDAEIQLVGDEQVARSEWLGNAQERQGILKANQII